jgi:hypothetical protein
MTAGPDYALALQVSLDGIESWVKQIDERKQARWPEIGKAYELIAEARKNLAALRACAPDEKPADWPADEPWPPEELCGG